MFVQKALVSKRPNMATTMQSPHKGEKVGSNFNKEKKQLSQANSSKELVSKVDV